MVIMTAGNPQKYSISDLYIYNRKALRQTLSPSVRIAFGE
jgi:hypothetical protein